MMYLIHIHTYIKKIIYLQVKRFQKIDLLIVQYKYLKSCSKHFILQNLILRTRLCGTTRSMEDEFEMLVELQIQIKPKSGFEFVPRDTEESNSTKI